MKRFALICLWMAISAAAARGQTEGIFADFSTSKGAFTVWLDHSNAPRAVASFVGLATGASGWADPQGNVWHKPFYDSSLFHRVPKDTNSNGIAIQGGGVSTCGISYTNLPSGPAENDGGIFFVVTTNPPGITTNDFLLGLVPFTTVNRAAVPTNFSYGGVVVATNAPALTRTVIYLSAWSSNATKYVANSYTKESWYTNFTLQEVETTNYATIYTVTTNPGPSSEVLLHRVQLSMAATTTIWGPLVATNFANAGYYMLDSATNGLSHSNGVISLANSGPNTDGSQFFIMATNYPYWNGSYSVFGHVTTGMNVVTSIAAVAVQGQWERPVQDVVLSNVVIRRVGASAVNFNIASQGLPVVESAMIPRVVATGNLARVEVEIPPYSEIRFRTSTNGLQSWRLEDWGYQTNGIVDLRQTNLVAGLHAFFHAVCIRYSDAWTAPTHHRGKVFSFVWNTDPPTFYDIAFTNPALSGEYAKSQGTNHLAGQVFGVPYAPNWTHYPYSAKLYFADNLGQYSYSLWFDPGKATNRFTATELLWAGGARALSGTFTVH